MVIGAENHNFRGFADVTFTKHPQAMLVKCAVQL